MLSSATPVELGLVITFLGLFYAVLRGLGQINDRFNQLENQVKTALQGRMTKSDHRIWVLEMQVRNPALVFPPSEPEE